MNINLTSIFLLLFELLSLTSQFPAPSPRAWHFLNAEISQGSVATLLSLYSEKSINDFIANQ